LREGLNVHDRQLTHPAVAQAFGMPHVAAAEVVARGGVAAG
jgi:alanine dehydrogenase